MNDRLAITGDPLAVSDAIAFVSDSAAGGICIFLGTTRAQSNADGHCVVALDYEAYAEMACRQFSDLAAEARARWPIIRLAVLHRTGRVALAEPSVLIAVSTAHRAESFAACRWLIDSVKSTAAIWKKEVWADGSAAWVGPD